MSPINAWFEVRVGQSRRLLFRYNPGLDMVEIKDGNMLVQVSLLPYRYLRPIEPEPEPSEAEVTRETGESAEVGDV